MKILFVWISVMFMSSLTMAKTTYLSDRDSDYEKSKYPAQLIEILTGSKKAFTKANANVYTLNVRDVFCLTRMNTGLDNENIMAGIAAVDCYSNTPAEYMNDTSKIKKANKLSESISLNNFLGRIKLVDCGAGSCLGTFKAISCVVDTSAISGSGRFSCSIEDNN